MVTTYESLNAPLKAKIRYNKEIYKMRRSDKVIIRRPGCVIVDQSYKIIFEQESKVIVHVKFHSSATVYLL